MQISHSRWRESKTTAGVEIKMKEVLIVVNLAGFLNFLWNDIDTLQSMGYKVSVAMNGKLVDGSNAVEIPMLDEKKIKHYQIDFNTKSPLARENIKAYKQLCVILKQNGFDLIHCHTPIAGTVTRIAANKYRKKGTKVIYTTHGFTFTDRTSKKSWIVYYNIEKAMSWFCDAIVTINHEDYKNAKTMHCKNVFIIPSVGLSNDRFKTVEIDREAYRQSIGVEKGKTMILTVGELSARKNQQIIIKAIGKLKNKDKFVLVICGHAIVSSTLESDLKKLAKELGVNISMLGHRLDIPEINTCADIAVIASLREGFGMAGVEAMAVGVPVIGSDVQGIREYIVPGKTGYFCDPTNELTIATAINTLTAMDEKEKNDMRKECKKMAMKFDEHKSKEKMAEIYRSILEGDNQ